MAWARPTHPLAGPHHRVWRGAQPGSVAANLKGPVRVKQLNCIQIKRAPLKLLGHVPRTRWQSDAKYGLLIERQDTAGEEALKQKTEHSRPEQNSWKNARSSELAKWRGQASAPAWAHDRRS